MRARNELWQADRAKALRSQRNEKGFAVASGVAFGLGALFSGLAIAAEQDLDVLRGQASDAMGPPVNSAGLDQAFEDFAAQRDRRNAFAIAAGASVAVGALKLTFSFGAKTATKRKLEEVGEWRPEVGW